MSSENSKSTSSTLASRDRSATDEKISRLYWFMSAVVLAVVVSYFLILFDSIKEKEWFLKYTDVYQDYAHQNIELNNKLNLGIEEFNNLLNEQKIEIEKLKNETSSLKRANPYLK